MKKLVFITCLFFISSASFAQRVADISINMTSPSNGATINGTQSFNFSATLTNSGPDTLKTTDTLVLGFTIDNSLVDVVVNGQTLQQVGTVLQQNMAPGVSGNFNFNIGLATAPSSGSHSFCVVIAALNRSVDSVTDNNTSNNQSCTTVTVAPSAGIAAVAGNGLSVTGVYPNPATAVAHVALHLDHAAPVAFRLTDLSGKVVLSDDKGVLAAGDRELEVNTRQLPAGIYLYQLTVGDHAAHGKLVVAH